jgi:tellurite resistance protein
VTHAHFSLEDLAALLERACPATALTLHVDRIRIDSPETPCDARVTGCGSGHLALAFACPLGDVEHFEDHAPLTKLLASLASTACVRAIINDDRLSLELQVIPSDIAQEHLDAVVRWHLAELTTVARAWRRRLGLSIAPPPTGVATTLAELVRTTPVAPQKALLVAAVGFAVAGADGRLCAAEADRLHRWLGEIPSFAAIDPRRLIAAIATLVSDSARTLLEARRRLDPRERLLAWALANDMAHADGFSSSEEQRYLSSVASIFELGPDEMEPFLADAREHAVRRETLSPPAVAH